MRASSLARSLVAAALVLALAAPARADLRLTTKIVERTLGYNVVTKEFKVAALHGETRPVFATRELRDAQRVLSELRGLKLTPATALDTSAVIYIRASA